MLAEWSNRPHTRVVIGERFCETFLAGYRQPRELVWRREVSLGIGRA
jgi:hypothetical protein